MNLSTLQNMEVRLSNLSLKLNENNARALTIWRNLTILKKICNISLISFNILFDFFSSRSYLQVTNKLPGK